MRPALTLAAALTLLAACADGSAGSPADSAAATPTAAMATSTPAPAPEGSAPAPTDGPPAVVPDALQFSAPLVGGGTVDMAAYAGTTVALWFWAPT